MKRIIKRIRKGSKREQETLKEMEEDYNTTMSKEMAREAISNW